MADDKDLRFDQWMQIAVRFFVLSNAGGAVAVLSFIGASMTNGNFPKIAIVPLFFFISGLVVAGTVIVGQLTGAYRGFLTQNIDPIAADISIQRSWVTKLMDRVESRTGTFLAIAFVLFVLGAGVGLVALAVW